MCPLLDDNAATVVCVGLIFSFLIYRQAILHLRGFRSPSPDGDGVVDSAIGLENEQTSIFDKVVTAGHEEEVVGKNLIKDV